MQVSAFWYTFSTREGGNQYFLLKVTKSWPLEAKKLGLLGQFRLILIFHGNPASRQDCETQEQKYLHFIEDSERPGQNPYKNALNPGVNAAPNFYHQYKKNGINSHFPWGKIAEKKILFPWQLAIAYTQLNPTRTYF